MNRTQIKQAAYIFGGIVFVAITIAFLALVFKNISTKTSNKPTVTTSTSGSLVVSPAIETTSTPGVMHYPFDELRRFSDNELLSGNWNEVESEEATNTFHYINVKNDFSLEIPYNNHWNVMGFTLDPIEPISEDELVFGPLRVVPFEGCCAIERDFNLAIIPARSVAAIQAEEASTSNITVEMMNGFKVVKKSYICPPGERNMDETSAECFFERALRYEVLLNGTNIVFSASAFSQNGDVILRQVIESLKIKPREALTEEQYKSDPSCGWTSPDTDTPDVRISYVDTSTHTSITLPYNNNWGGARCGLAPYEDHYYENDIHNVVFGPFVGGEGGSGRGSWVTFETPTSSAGLLALLRAKVGDNTSSDWSTSLATTTVGVVTVYRYSLDDLGGTQEWHVANPSVHLVLHSVFGALHESEALKIIQSLKVVK